MLSSRVYWRKSACLVLFCFCLVPTTPSYQSDFGKQTHALADIKYESRVSFSVAYFSLKCFFFLITHFSALFSCNMSKLSTALKHWTVNKQLDFSLDIWSASKSLWGQFYINLKSDSVLLKRKRKQRVIESLMIRQSGGYLRWSHRCHHLFSLFS